MNMDKLKEVFSEEAFVKALFEMETVTEMQQALSSKGIQMSDEEVAGIRDFFDKVKRGELSREQLEAWSKLAENGELSEEMLEMVNGGTVGTGVFGGLIGLVVGSLIANVICPGFGSFLAMSIAFGVTSGVGFGYHDFGIHDPVS